MLFEKLKGHTLILASKSPRRQELMKLAGFSFLTSAGTGVVETYPEGLSGEEIAAYLAEMKSEAYPKDPAENEIIITADTIVWQAGTVLHKPADMYEAAKILRRLSDAEHSVYTGVCLRSATRKRTFVAGTEVVFGHISDAEINYYIQHYKPLDKAGAYGIQEWIGFIGVEAIRGSYFNVMGLPLHQLYRELEKFV